MKIDDHRLQEVDGTPITWKESPNQSGDIDPVLLIMHYTAGRSADTSIDWFTKSEAQASAHLVIGRDGSLTQMVPFNKKAWHAGRSEWKGLSGLNSHSIGIELDHPGSSVRNASGRWESWFKETYPDEEILERTHIHQSKAKGWHAFTQIQLEVAARVGEALVAEYGLVNVLGHDDVSPDRKEDPGPTFPMSGFRRRVMGWNARIFDLWAITAAGVVMRTHPQVGENIIPGSPLKNGARVLILDEHEEWRFVEVLEFWNPVVSVGWVHSEYLEKLSQRWCPTPDAVICFPNGNQLGYQKLQN